MSQLPQIDQSKVIQKLLDKNSDLTFQVTQLEVLAEALRDERDEALKQGSTAPVNQEPEHPVVDISSLPPQG